MHNVLNVELKCVIIALYQKMRAQNVRFVAKCML